MLDAWRARAATLGQTVKVTGPGGTICGRAVDVDDDKRDRDDWETAESEDGLDLWSMLDGLG